MRTGRAAVLPPPLGLIEPPRAARWTSLVPAGLVLLSVGMIVVSVLHDQMQRCIIIDTQHLLQVMQRSCTAISLLSHGPSVANMMHLVDMELCNVSEIVQLPEHAAHWSCSTGWCCRVRASRRLRRASAHDQVHWQQLAEIFLTRRGSLRAALALSNAPAPAVAAAGIMLAAARCGAAAHPPTPAGPAPVRPAPTAQCPTSRPCGGSGLLFGGGAALPGACARAGPPLPPPTRPTAYGLIYLFTYLIVASEPGGGSVDHDTGGDARPQPGTGPTAAGDGALSAPPLPACCAQRRRCRANPDVADHVRRRGARGRGVLQLPCRVRACCRGRAGRSASLPVVAAVARAANRGAGRAAGRAGFGASETVSGVAADEPDAPLPAPALSEDRRAPALHTGT